SAPKLFANLIAGPNVSPAQRTISSADFLPSSAFRRSASVDVYLVASVTIRSSYSLFTIACPTPPRKGKVGDTPTPPACGAVIAPNSTDATLRNAVAPDNRAPRPRTRLRRE